MNSYSAYLLKAGDFYKIGHAKNVAGRIKAVQVGCPFDITLMKKWDVRSMASARRIESDLHRKFESKLQRGEWFRLDDEDVSELVGMDAESFDIDKNGQDLGAVCVSVNLPERIYMKDAGRLLRQAIRDSPYTIEQVADRIGISNRSMQLFFKKSTDWRVTGAILDLLGCNAQMKIEVKTPTT